MQKLLIAVYFLFGACTLGAQGWERHLSERPYNDGHNLLVLPDGSFLLAMPQGTGPVDSFSLTVVSADGFEQATAAPDWLTRLQIPTLGLGANEDQLLFAGFTQDTMLEVTATGLDLEVQWTAAMGFTFPCNTCLPTNLFLAPTIDGYVLGFLSGNDYFDTIPGLPPLNLLKVDFNGQVLWEKVYDFTAMGSQLPNLRDIESDSLGNIYLTGGQDTQSQTVLAKFRPDGEMAFLTANLPGLGSGTADYSLVVLHNNLILLAVDQFAAGLFDSTGTLLEQYPQVNYYAHHTRSVDGNIFKVSLKPGAAPFETVIEKTQPDGTLLWVHETSPLPWINNLHAIRGLHDGGVIALGSCHLAGDPNMRPYLIRLDANGNSFTNYVSGSLTADTSGSCDGQLPVPGTILSFRKGDTGYFAVTDTQGMYSVRLDSGTYAINLAPQAPIWSLCDSAMLSVTVGPLFDTVQSDHVLRALAIDCPWMTVDLATNFLRRCFETTYHVQYANFGTTTADSVWIEISLDTALTLQGASVPIVALDSQHFAVHVGSVPPFTTGTFQLGVAVSCDVDLGATTCITATLHLDNPCVLSAPDSTVLTVTGVCTGDSVQFTVTNAGAAMSVPAQFIIIEDLIVMKEGSFELGAQQDTVLTCAADGSTFRMYAGFESGAVPFLAPTAAVEGCNGPLSAGVWAMFPAIDLPDSTAHDCLSVIGSYDPNDKMGLPSGYGPEHYVAPGVPLNYRIRFQNVGTDTAFTVVIRDTLSPWLNPTTLRLGAASHPFSWQLLGQGVLVLTFSGIMLPDSNVNEPASHGFVTYSIGQQSGVLPGTDIFNSAAIYFDFNAPVITNTTRHRVEDDFLVVQTWRPELPALTLRVTPNPASGPLTLVVDGLRGSVQLEVHDAVGRLVTRRDESATPLQIDCSAWPPGVYFVSVRQAGRLLGVGKVLRQ